MCEKEALQKYENNMRDKNQQHEKKNSALEEENRELKERLYKLELAEKEAEKTSLSEKQIITPIVRLAPTQSSSQAASFNSQQTLSPLPSIPTISPASQVSQPIVPARKRGIDTEPEGQSERKKPRTVRYNGPNY